MDPKIVCAMMNHPPKHPAEGATVRCLCGERSYTVVKP
jgi:hypothetical protein